MDLIKVKADIICHGLLGNDLAREIYEHQNPSEMHKQGRYFGIMIKFQDNISVLANVVYDNVDKVKYKLGGSIDNLVLLDMDDKVISKVTYIDPPKWYDKKTSSNKNTSEVFIDEGERYLHMTYNGCDYYKCNMKCKFCGCGERINESTPDEIAEVVGFAKDERDYHVCLGGGTYLPLKKSTDNFIDIIKKIRVKAKSIPIWVEMVPPTRDEIKSLVEAGATSFGFNIEIFDEDLRRKVCPGKGAISIDEYIKRGVYANSLLGGNKVGSTLICGLAPIETIKLGIDELTKNKIHPCILAFRPSENSEYQAREECDTDEFYECSKYAAEKMLDGNLDIFKNEGCLLCEYCTIMHDLTREILKERGEKEI